MYLYIVYLTDDEVVLNPKDYPGLKVHDVVEIYHPEDEYRCTLLSFILTHKHACSVRHKSITLYLHKVKI